MFSLSRVDENMEIKFKKKHQEKVFHGLWRIYSALWQQEKKSNKSTVRKVFNREGKLQSRQVKRTPQDSINEFIVQKLNLLVVVDFRFISAFLRA